MNLKKFLNEEQDPKAVEKLLGRINSLLTSQETMEYIAVQKKPVLNLSPDCIALTNRRIIFCRPKNFGLSMDFQDYSWVDVADCHIKEGIVGSTFMVKTTQHFTNMMDYLPKNQARKLYQFAQEVEERMRGVRREKNLETLRASAGGVTVNNATPIITQPQMFQEEKKPLLIENEDPFALLQKLKGLKESGVISPEEFETKKNEILSRV
ncbi:MULTISPECIES: PH domain-containing protein [Chryseobacterium]|jgi:Bacterial PH domain/Short C-terminal domain|uniref:PH domain-containing protein n=2 Tax=Chryseobacterium TaxID=59732 RepID=A0AAJ1VJX5_9FLAO|nr:MULTISPECIES: PH domain-containing protein [Chryseobacterium]MCF2220906.1 PH domain-containing protein [Chryseobacterium sp. PS-8]MDN4012156.1 PH domain-containing protein [Chryseobacterium gambrini]MDN4029676.1 PH domain-containing protein [Chryseobacterium gambrini]QWA37100.1 PH domain-containing protein [Chryseobacterium sp. ZHDP1]WBV51336.1 PH domain-containing protein [Chryseobacterium gambrini]